MNTRIQSNSAYPQNLGSSNTQLICGDYNYTRGDNSFQCITKPHLSKWSFKVTLLENRVIVWFSKRTVSGQNINFNAPSSKTLLKAMTALLDCFRWQWSYEQCIEFNFLKKKTTKALNQLLYSWQHLGQSLGLWLKPYMYKKQDR